MYASDAVESSISSRLRSLAGIRPSAFSSDNQAEASVGRRCRMQFLLVIRGGMMRYPRNTSQHKGIARIALDEVRCRPTKVLE